MFWTLAIDALKGAVEVTAFVALMMILIEALNIESHGRIFKRLEKSRLGQISVASLLGATPGCVGGYATTSLYNHGMISFGSLAAMMVATCGDETFIMLAMFPKTAAAIITGLFVAGIAVGFTADAVRARKVRPSTEEEPCHEMERESGKRSFRQFLKENVLHHVILHHVPKIFAWTLGVLLLMGILEQYIDVESWASGNAALLIVIAALVGLIPESGPHLVFVTLYASGAIPLPVLLASCISQDGHASLPLLAENRRTFFATKALTCVLGMAAGFISLLIMG